MYNDAQQNSGKKKKKRSESEYGKSLNLLKHASRPSLVNIKRRKRRGSHKDYDQNAKNKHKVLDWIRKNSALYSTNLSKLLETMIKNEIPDELQLEEIAKM